MYSEEAPRKPRGSASEQGGGLFSGLSPVEVGSQDLAVDPSNLRCTSADTKRRNSTVSKMIENTAEKDLRS